MTEGVHGKIECTPSNQLHVHIPHVCQTKNNLFYWLHLVYNTDYHQPRAMLLQLEQWRLMMPCASAAPRCGACRAGVTAPDAVRG